VDANDSTLAIELLSDGELVADSILKAGLVAFLVTLFDEATETVISDVNRQDRLPP
jgi:hypothetical protein